MVVIVGDQDQCGKSPTKDTRKSQNMTLLVKQENGSIVIIIIRKVVDLQSCKNLGRIPFQHICKIPQAINREGS